MPHGPGDVPMLRKRSLHRLVQLNQSAIYERAFPIQQLFMLGNGGQPRLVNAEEIAIRFKKALRLMGKLHSQPGAGDNIATATYGKRLVSTMYQRYEDRIPPNHVASMLLPDMPQGYAAATQAASRAEAQRWLDMSITDLSEIIYRVWELNAALLLKSGATANLATIGKDGMTGTIEVPTFIDAATDASGKWSGSGHDIVADLGSMYRTHVQKAGEEPTHIIYDFRLVEDLAANTSVRSVLNNSRGAVGNVAVTDFPTELLPTSMRDAQKIEVRGWYYADAAAAAAKTRSFYWDRYTVTFLSLQQPSNVLDMITAPTTSDDYAGGVYGKSYIDQKTDETCIVVGANGAPTTLDGSKVTIFNVDP